MNSSSFCDRGLWVSGAREHGEEVMFFFELSKLHAFAMRKTGRGFYLMPG